MQMSDCLDKVELTAAINSCRSILAGSVHSSAPKTERSFADQEYKRAQLPHRRIMSRTYVQTELFCWLLRNYIVGKSGSYSRHVVMSSNAPVTGADVIARLTETLYNMLYRQYGCGRRLSHSRKRTKARDFRAGNPLRPERQESYTASYAMHDGEDGTAQDMFCWSHRHPPVAHRSRSLLSNQ